MPYFPGTAGTVVGIAVYLIISPMPWTIALITMLAFTALAWYVSAKAERLGPRKDPPHIVIDEILGYQWTMLFVAPSIENITLGFIFFRFFDMVKPFPLRLLQEKLQGGLGIISDDLAAALYARLCLMMVLRIVG